MPVVSMEGMQINNRKIKIIYSHNDYLVAYMPMK